MDVKECFWYELHALSHDIQWMIQYFLTRISIGAYLFLPNPGLIIEDNQSFDCSTFVWMEVLSAHGTELHLFEAKAFSLLLLLMSRI